MLKIAGQTYLTIILLLLLRLDCLRLATKSRPDVFYPACTADVHVCGMINLPFVDVDDVDDDQTMHV